MSLVKFRQERSHWSISKHVHSAIHLNFIVDGSAKLYDWIERKFVSLFPVWTVQAYGTDKVVTLHWSNGEFDNSMVSLEGARLIGVCKFMSKQMKWARLSFREELSMSCLYSENVFFVWWLNVINVVCGQLTNVSLIWMSWHTMNERNACVSVCVFTWAQQMHLRNLSKPIRASHMECMWQQM